MKLLLLLLTVLLSALCSLAFAQSIAFDNKPPELSPYVFWFGPVGVAFGLVALIVGYFYRKDLLQRVRESEAREKIYHAMLVSNAIVLQEVRDALVRQSATNDTVSRAVLAFIEHLSSAERLRKMEGR